MLNVDEAPVAPGGSTHAKPPPGTVGVTVMSQPGAGAYTTLVAVCANLRIVSDGEHNSSTSVRIASASTSKSSINATSVVSMSNPAMVRATTGPDTCVSRVTLAWFCNAAPTPIANTRDPRALDCVGGQDRPVLRRSRSLGGAVGADPDIGWRALIERIGRTVEVVAGRIAVGDEHDQLSGVGWP